METTVQEEKAWTQLKMMESSEAATGGVLYETVFLEILQNSQGARVSTRIFSSEFCEISKNTFFYRSPIGECF